MAAEIISRSTLTRNLSLKSLGLALAQSEARCEMQQGMVAELRAFLAARDELGLPNQA